MSWASLGSGRSGREKGHLQAPPPASRACAREGGHEGHISRRYRPEVKKVELSGASGLPFGAALIALLMCLVSEPAAAQTAESSLKQSCTDATRAFSLRQEGIEELAVADPAAIGKLRQAALFFYRCAQREPDPYMREMFSAYYANTLYSVGQNTNEARATALAVATAQRLNSSQYDDVRALVAKINVPSPSHRQTAPTQTPVNVTHSNAYCHDFKSGIVSALEALNDAVSAVRNAGNNDTQVLASTTARYGGAFSAVEDDFNTAQSNLETARSALSSAGSAADGLNDQEKPKAVQTLQAISTTIYYTDVYNRLALQFERGINNANRQLARARIAQALAAGMQPSSYSYSSGNATCYSWSTNSVNCYGNSHTTTTYNNSAITAQQNAANAIAAAQAGRLSYSQADALLMEGLPIFEQIRSNIYAGLDSWNKKCPGS